MDYSADPRVVAIRADHVINGPKATGVVRECFSDAELVAELDDVDCCRSWGEVPAPIRSVAKAVAHYRRYERLKKAQWAEAAAW
jgi:hypothetical protein